MGRRQGKLSSRAQHTLGERLYRAHAERIRDLYTKVRRGGLEGRLVEPRLDDAIADAREKGITDKEIDAIFNIVNDKLVRHTDEHGFIRGAHTSEFQARGTRTHLPEFDEDDSDYADDFYAYYPYRRNNRQGRR